MVFYENYILLLMHKKSYGEAAKTFHSSFYEIPWKEMPKFHQERWKLVQAWLYLVSEKDYQAYIPGGFRFSRTINEIRSIAADKKGLNISLLILEICMHIKNGNEKERFNKMEELKTHRTKYIRKGASKRTQIFIKMLLALDASNYDPGKAIMASAQWTKKLHANPYTFPGDFEGFEVILFEDLWEKVLGWVGITN